MAETPKRKWLRRSVEPPEPEAPSALDADAVRREHGVLVAEFRARGAADARRHEEDLLDRPLPAAEECAAIGVARLERVGAERQQALADIEIREQPLGQRLGFLQRQLDALTRALYREGCPEQMEALPPRAVAGWDSWLPWRARYEPRHVVRLRKTYERVARELERVCAEIESLAAERRGVIFRSARVAAAERALPRELLATYRSAVMGALSPGCLADGADLGEAPDPTPDWPEWADPDLEVKA
jgi:hypothetical protein